MKDCILHLRASNFVGGPEKQILRYAERTLNGRVDVCIASFCDQHEGAEFLREAADRGNRVLPLPAHSIVDSIRVLSEAIRARNVRLLCVHGYKSAVVGAIASRLTGVPFVCFLRGWTRENRKVAFYERLERMCARFADRVVCLSETLANGAKGEFEPSLVRVVVNAARIRNYTPEQRNAARRRICAIASFNPEQPLIVAAGRLSPEKGTATLLEAAHILSAAHPDFQFVIFGDGAERQRLLQQLSSLRLKRTVCFAGHHKEFANLVAGADILVNPSLTEQMPNVVLEAMSAGVPAIATAVGGIPELARDGAVALVAPNNPGQLAEAIADVVENPSRRRAVRQKAYERLVDDFSQENQAAQLESLYLEFIALPNEEHRSSYPCVSVVIPVRNEELRLPALLQSLRNQDYPAELVEILVADGMSTDRTPDLISRFASEPGASIRLVKNPRKLSSAGRNVGAAEANGDIFLFVDGHCHIPTQNFLTNVVELMNSTGAEILCRPQPLDFPESSFVQKAIAAGRSSWLGHGLDSTIYSTHLEGWVNPSSSGAIYRRSVFERFGGFDESFDACEDVEFNYRLHQQGAKGYISPKLTVFYEPRKTLGAFFRQTVRYGKGRIRLARKHPGSFSASQLAPAAIVLLALLGPLVLFTPWRYVWVLLMALYAALVVIESGRITRQGMASALLISLAFVTIHTGLGTGMLVEWIMGDREFPARVPAAAAWSKHRQDDSGRCPNGPLAQRAGER